MTTSSNDNDLDEKLRALPVISPPDDVARRALAGYGSPLATPLPVGPRVVLFLTVLVYLGWAFRAASLVAQ